MVGQRIEKYLNDNGIKKSFLADKVGITRQKMSRVCNADVIDCILYSKICKALNVPYGTFIDD